VKRKKPFNIIACQLSICGIMRPARAKREAANKIGRNFGKYALKSTLVFNYRATSSNDKRVKRSVLLNAICPQERQLMAAKKQWHAVAIRPRGGSCEAVQACKTARYLSQEAPRLPLAECTASDTCTCVYKHHDDRRLKPRRHDEAGELRRGAKVGQERRLRGDRRKSD
jgi:hypothetical protein